MRSHLAPARQLPDPERLVHRKRCIAPTWRAGAAVPALDDTALMVQARQLTADVDASTARMVRIR